MAFTDPTISSRLAGYTAEREGRSLRVMFRAWAAELAPFPHRWRRAARVAFVTAVGAGLMATVQIVNPLGLTLLVSFAAPEYAFSLGTGVGFLIGAAAIQTLALFVIGAMVDNPVVLICAFIALTAVSTYLIYGVPRLGRLWLWAQIPSLTAFYMVLFTHRTLGWDNAQMFSGVAIAVALLWLFNNVIWPQPAEAVLSASLQSTLVRSRRRLDLLMAIFLGDKDPDHDRGVASKLAYHLALLKPATRESHSIRGAAQLLATVMVTERIHNEIDRLCVVACRQAGRDFDASHRRELLDVVSNLAAALDHYIATINSRGLTEPDELLSTFRNSIAPLANSRDSDAAALASHLETIGTLLVSDPLELPAASTPPPPRAPATRPFHLNRFLVRFCVRHTFAMTAAFIAGLFDNNAALHAALWLLMIGGPPSHGATARKFTMRAIGATGALMFAALGTIILAPNFTSTPPYMAAIFVGVLLMTYLSEGGGELSYLGIGATAFVIAFSGPGPRPEIIGSIWTIWGISFGMIIRAIVSVYSIEWPNRTVAEEVERPLAAMVKLVPGAQRSPEEIATAQMEVIAGIEAMLDVAADAQLQGPSIGLDARELVDALDTMRRLAFTLGNLSAANERTDFDQALREQLTSWLTNIREQLEPGHLTPAPLRTMVLNAPMVALTAAPSDQHIADLMLTLEGQLPAISLR